MSGKASVFSPSNQPVLEGRVIRNPTRVQQQGGTGGDPEFPFQWSVPGLVNYAPAVGQAIPAIRDKSLNWIYWTFVTNPTTWIDVEFYIDGVYAFGASGLDSNGANFIESGFVPAGSVIGMVITNVGSGDAEGLWVGLTTYIDTPP